jgi:hypothetical protein
MDEDNSLEITKASNKNSEIATIGKSKQKSHHENVPCEGMKFAFLPCE